MGVTIHFEGRLRSRESLDRLLGTAEAVAARLNWPCRKISSERVHLTRTVGESETEYVGPSAGIELIPHDRSDPLRLEFDADLFVQDFVKTQFAGVEVHARIVGVLREIEPYFESLVVEDEGELWTTDDNQLLEAHFSSFDRALADYLRDNPNAHGPVRLESGRWVDVVA
ncbi:MAG: hypothetical protein SFV24_23345 [Gemmatimonadales bacterium]|nr:hypothetical protein [Gemmatimonadales bacterium]